MKNNPVGWFEIYVQDMPRAKTFYESVFQGKLEKLTNPNDDIELELWAFPMQMDALGASGALVKLNGVDSGGNSTLVYFRCEDCAVEEKRVAQFGGQIHRKKIAIGEYGFISLVLDTEGNMIGLHSMQ
jgi:predicted enzyme related to lactoylglutathione lyase